MVQRLIEFWNALRSVFRLNGKEGELDEEVRFHLEEREDELVEQGYDPKTAQWMALREFGGVEKFKEETRDSWGVHILIHVVRDLKLGLRVLRREKSFSATVVSILALCIGCNIAMFSMFSTLVLRPLPFPDSDRVVEIYNTYPKLGPEKGASSIRAYNDYRENTDVFSDLTFVFREGASTFAMGTGPEGMSNPHRVNLRSVTGEFFDVLGLQPILGTFFLEEDLVHPGNEAVVISHTFWKNALGGDQEIIGKRVFLNDTSKVIRGVAPEAFEVFYPYLQVIASITWAEHLNTRFVRYGGDDAQLFGRLKTGVTNSHALHEIRNRDKIYNEQTPSAAEYVEQSGHLTQLGTLKDERISRVKPVLIMLQFGALFVLAIGNVNLINLLLARANKRLPEMMTRRSLGAGIFSTVCLWGSEGLLLTLTGALFGYMLGWAGIEMINRYAMEMLPPMLPLEMDLYGLVFTLVLAVLCGITLVLVPFVRLLRLNTAKESCQGARSSSHARSFRWVGSLLGSGQIGLTLVLLVVAGLLVSSFSKMLSKDLGFNPEGIYTIRLVPPSLPDAEGVKLQQLLIGFMDSLREIPEVSQVAISKDIPMTTRPKRWSYFVSGQPTSSNESLPTVLECIVSPGYFETMGIQFIQGETFSMVSESNRRREVIIDKRIADRHFPDGNAIGQKLGIQIGNFRKDESTIVGVVTPVQHSNFGTWEFIPTLYDNVFQRRTIPFSLMIKSKLEPDLLLSIVRSRVHEMDPAIPIFLTGEMEYFVSKAMNNHRAVMWLLCMFAGISLLLSVAGIYGLITYSVEQRRQEIGIRSAIGASPQHMMKLLIGQGICGTVVGILMGLVGAFFLTKILSSVLYEVKPFEPWLYLLLTMLIAVVAGMAYYSPARKAVLANPAEALRTE